MVGVGLGLEVAQGQEGLHGLGEPGVPGSEGGLVLGEQQWEGPLEGGRQLLLGQGDAEQEGHRDEGTHPSLEALKAMYLVRVMLGGRGAGKAWHNVLTASSSSL